MSMEEVEESKRGFWTVDRVFQILMAITAVAILTTAIVFKQPFWKVLPLFVSLFIMLLNSKINKFGLLLGSLNSILYAIVYLSYKLYAMAIYAVLVSFPLQIVAFIRWKRRPSGQSTVLGRLSNRMRLVFALSFVVGWLAFYFILSAFDSGYLVLDNTTSLLGITASVLTIFAVIEYTWINALTSTISIVLYSSMLAENPEQITYLIYTIFSMLCIIRSVIRSTKLYNEQKNKENEK